MDEYVIHGETAEGVLQISSRKPKSRPSLPAKAAGPRKLHKPVHDEVKLLFHWTMLNLPKEVPGDIRSYLQAFID
jgi:hypothetical protein